MTTSQFRKALRGVGCAGERLRSLARDELLALLQVARPEIMGLGRGARRGGAGGRGGPAERM